MKTKIYISNITSDIIKTDGRVEITKIGLHELKCDRQIEGGKPEKQIISILAPNEYYSVLKNGYYIVTD